MAYSINGLATDFFTAIDDVIANLRDRCATVNGIKTNSQGLTSVSFKIDITDLDCYDQILMDIEIYLVEVGGILTKDNYGNHSFQLHPTNHSSNNSSAASSSTTTSTTSSTTTSVSSPVVRPTNSTNSTKVLSKYVRSRDKDGKIIIKLRSQIVKPAAATKIVKKPIIRLQKIFRSEQCLICYTDFKEEKVHPLQCGHYQYHKDCLTKCADATCPTCRLPHNLKVTGEKIKDNLTAADSLALANALNNNTNHNPPNIFVFPQYPANQYSQFVPQQPYIQPFGQAPQYTPPQNPYFSLAYQQYIQQQQQYVQQQQQQFQQTQNNIGSIQAFIQGLSGLSFPPYH